MAGLDTVEAVMGTLVGNLTKVSGIFEQIASPLSTFVSALSPGTMQAFHYAMKGLYATIGSALLPVMQHLITMVQNASAIMMPAVQALKPVFNELGNALRAFIIPIVMTVAKELQESAPLFKSIAEVLTVLGAVFQVFTIIVKSIFDAFKHWVGGEGGGIQKIVDTVKRALITLATAVLQVAISIAKMLGATGFIDAVHKNLEATKDAGLKKGGVAGAVESPSIQGFEAIAKQLAQSSVLAGAGTQPESDVDILKGIREQLKEPPEWIGKFEAKIDAISKDITKFKEKWVDNFSKSFKSEVWDPIAGTLGGAVTKTIGMLIDVIRPIANALFKLG